MSDFFGGLNGFRLPDAKINGGGPLPTDISGPAGINGDPDGKYNATGSLLDGVQPYSGPKQGRMGSDRNYQQIPHRRMAFIPMLHLPEPSHKSQATFELSHGVDMGDIAWIADLPSKHLLTVNRAARSPYNSNSYTNIDTFLNVATLNYLLAGFQRCGRERRSDRGAWQPLMDDVRWDDMMKSVDQADRDKPKHMIGAVMKVCSVYMRPFGICAGSEKQGGLHEGSLAPVQAAVTHTTTLTVDGQNRDLVNYWLHTKLDAGDNLIFRLAYKPTKHFSLNHYYKNTVSRSFDDDTPCWQIVPDTARGLQKQLYDHAVKVYKQNERMHHILNPLPPELEWHWRVAQTFVARASFRNDDAANDDLAFAGISQLLEGTFAPVLVEPHRRRARRHTLAVWDQTTARDAGVEAREDADRLLARPHVAALGPYVIGQGRYRQDVDFVDGLVQPGNRDLTSDRAAAAPGRQDIDVPVNEGAPVNGLHASVWTYGGIGDVHATRHEQFQNRLRTLLQRKLKGEKPKGKWYELAKKPPHAIEGNIMTNFVDMIRAERLQFMAKFLQKGDMMPNEKEQIKAALHDKYHKVAGYDNGQIQRDEGRKYLASNVAGQMLKSAAARWLDRMGWDGVFGAHMAYNDLTRSAIGVREDIKHAAGENTSVTRVLTHNKTRGNQLIQEFLLALLQPRLQNDPVARPFITRLLRPERGGQLFATAAPMTEDMDDDTHAPTGLIGGLEGLANFGGAGVEISIDAAAPAAQLPTVAEETSADLAGAAAPAAKRRKGKKSFELTLTDEGDTRSVVPQ